MSRILRLGCAFEDINQSMIVLIQAWQMSEQGNLPRSAFAIRRVAILRWCCTALRFARRICDLRDTVL